MREDAPADNHLLRQAYRLHRSLPWRRITRSISNRQATMSAATSELRHDTEVIGLVGFAHLFSHFLQLILAPLFPLLKEEFGVGYAALGLMVSVMYNRVRHLANHGRASSSIAMARAACCCSAWPRSRWRWCSPAWRLPTGCCWRLRCWRAWATACFTRPISPSSTPR